MNTKPIWYLKNVENVTVSSGAGQAILANCTNITAENLNISNCRTGILAAYSSFLFLRNSTIENNSEDGIHLKDSGSNTISNNTIQNNGEKGVYIEGSSNTIIGNTFQNNAYGIHLKESDSNSISNNTIQNNSWVGIKLQGSSNIVNNNLIQSIPNSGIELSGDLNTVANNIIQNNEDGGISLGGDSNNILNNTIQNNSGWGIGLFGDSNSILKNRILDSGSSGFYISGESNVISKNAIQNNEKYGIHITDGTAFNRISDNTIQNNRVNGIYLYKDSGYNIISNNVIQNHAQNGIYFNEGPSSNRISNNTIQNSTKNGIRFYQGNSNTISNNIIQNNTKIGIYFFNSNSNTISYNTIQNNNDFGIYLPSSDSNIISYNTIKTNLDYGIGLDHSDSNSISNNTISENGVGIYFEETSTDVTAHYNSIVNNIEYGIDASNNGGYWIDATDNWWGHASGPYHSSKNPGGKGDNITNYVDFDPWLKYDPLKALYVDDDAPDGGDGSKEKTYNKVQDAIDAAEDGDTIRVWAGTYEENVVVDKTVSLIGNGSEEVTIDGGMSGDVVRVTADWVNVSGFRVTNGDNGIYLDSSDHSIITNNTCSNNYYGIYLSYSNDCTISNNNCENNSGSGIYLESSSNCTIDSNTCENNNHGIGISDSGAFILMNNICSFNNRYGIFLESSGHRTFENNICNNNDIGIYLSNSFSTLTNNTFSSNNRYGIYLEISLGCELENNTISMNQVGIYLDTDQFDNVAHNNSIFGNTDYGIDASDNDGNTIDATKNWWGHTTGPYHDSKNPDGEGDNVTDYVEFDPWLEDDPRIKYVDDDAPDDGDGSREKPYNKIQDAIDAAGDGDTIRVWAGTYEENVVVDKTVSLIGNGSEDVVIDGGEDGNVVKITADWVNMSGFSVTGSGEEWRDAGIWVESDHSRVFENNCSNNDIGISLWYSTSSTIENNTCENNPFGIYLRDSSNCKVTGNTFSSNNNNGIYLDSSSDCKVTSNTCENNDYGISLDSSSDNTLENNTYKNNDYGIYFLNSRSCTVTNNTISENKAGIYLKSSSRDNEAHNNIITGNTDFGIDASDNEGDTIDATGNWWGHVSGPYHDTENTNGEANPVSDHVDFDPWTKEPPFDDYTPPGAFIDSVSPSNTNQGDEVEFSGHGTAYESLDRYAWESSIDGEFSNESYSDFFYTGLSNGTHTIYFRVRDNYGVWSGNDTTTLTINGRPRAEILDIWPNPAPSTDTIHFWGYGTDNGDIVRYAWSSSIDGMLYEGTEGEFETASLSLGTHTISFKVQDNNGVWSEEVTVQLQVINPPPQAYIDNIWPSPAPSTDTIYFSGYGTDNGEVVRYVWELDGEEVYNGTEQHFQHDPLPTGTYTITVRVQDDEGAWSEEVNETLIVHERPIAYINDISPDPALTTDTVHLSGSGTDDNNITRYYWRSSRDGALNTMETIYDHRFFMGGDYTLDEVQEDPEELFIEADYDDYDFFRANRRWVDVGSWTFVSPDMDITLRGSMLLNIHYIIMDDDFEALPQFRFTLTSGGFPVAQREGNEGSPTPGEPEVYALTDYLDTIFLPAGTELVLELEYIGWENASLYLDNLSYESYLEFYRVDMVKGGQNLNVTGLSVGEHTIYLSAMDNYGAWSYEVSWPLLVHERPEAEIKAITPSPAASTDTVRFRAKGKDDGEVERYHWTSSLDGELYNGTEYAAMVGDLTPGNHTIYLELMDDNGVWSELVETTLIIHTRPVAEIVSITPNPAPETKGVTFTGNGTDDGNITRYAWRTEEKELYNGSKDSFSYAKLATGTHTIYLKVMDNYGAWSVEVNETLTIHDRPTAGISAISPESVTAKKDVEFRAVGIDDGSIVRYVWTSSIDGEFYNDSEAVVSYSKLSAGTHTITLKVQDDDGAWSEEVSGTLVVKKADDEDEFFLVKKAGPLPVYGYLLVVIIAVVGCLLAFTRMGGASGSGEDSPSEQPGFEENEPSSDTGGKTLQQEEAAQPQPPQPGELPDTAQLPPGVKTGTDEPGKGEGERQERKKARAVVKKKPRVRKTGAWDCPKCKTTIGAKYPFCVECGEKKPSKGEGTGQKIAPSETWNCPKCSSKVPFQYPFCVECGEKKPEKAGKVTGDGAPAGTWSCPKCGTRVGATYPFCVECGEKKP